MRNAARDAVARAEAATGPKRTVRRSKPVPADVVAELERAVGPRRAERLAGRLAEASAAFERDRFQDAQRILRPLAEEAPSAGSIRELNGLALYRLERWKQAATELEAYVQLTGEVDQHPVLADCYRALKKYGKVAELWDELKNASPSAALVAEGRIVMAGAFADQGDLRSALALMAKTDATPARVRDHHLRLWYVLADLYDRSGDAPRARTLFRRIAEYDRGFADVAERLAALG